MPDAEGYDAVSAGGPVARVRRWRSPIYWIASAGCVGLAVLLIVTVGGDWFWIPLALWPFAGYLLDRRLTNA